MVSEPCPKLNRANNSNSQISNKELQKKRRRTLLGEVLDDGSPTSGNDHGSIGLGFSASIVND